MLNRYLLAATLAAATFGFVTSDAHAAFANAIGSSRYASKLSSNKSMKTQQLTADPTSVSDGQNTVSYDASVVTFKELIQSPVFSTSVTIGVKYFSDGSTAFVDFGTYLDDNGSAFTEIGQIRAKFSLTDTNAEQSIIDPLPGYVEIARSAEYDQGDDTYALIFALDEFAGTDRGLADSPQSLNTEETVATYQIYNNTAANDFLREVGSTEKQSFVFPAEVSGSFVPEPTGMVVLMLGGVALRRVRRAS